MRKGAFYNGFVGLGPTKFVGPLSVVVLAAPLSHRAAEAPLEENLQIAWIDVATFFGNRLYRAVRRGKKLFHGVQPVAGDHLVYGFSAELLESQIRKPPRHAEEIRDILDLDAFGGILADVRRRPREKVCRWSGIDGGFPLDNLHWLHEEGL